MTEHAPAPPSPHSGGNGRMVAGRYRLQGLLGRGGMAEVYRAHDTVLDRPVALKVFSPTVQADGDRDRFRAEVHLLASLSHPNLVALYDAGTDEARPWCALQLVDGGTLADVPVPAPPARLARMAADIACALDHVHAHGVVHRDVKPGNVLLGGGRAYLADFGIARLVDGGRLTQTGLMLGTAAFLSPEQVRGEGATPASDVYALGLVLLESLTGRREYEGLPVEAAMARLNRDPVVPGWLPAPWADLLRAMTAASQEARPAAGSVCEQLTALAGGSGPALPRAAPAAAPAAPAGPVAGVAAAVGAVEAVEAAAEETITRPLDLPTTAHPSPAAAQPPLSHVSVRAAAPAASTVPRPRDRRGLVPAAAAAVAATVTALVMSTAAAPSPPQDTAPAPRAPAASVAPGADPARSGRAPAGDVTVADGNLGSASRVALAGSGAAGAGDGSRAGAEGARSGETGPRPRKQPAADRPGTRGTGSTDAAGQQKGTGRAATDRDRTGRKGNQGDGQRAGTSRKDGQRTGGGSDGSGRGAGKGSGDPKSTA